MNWGFFDRSAGFTQPCQLSAVDFPSLDALRQECQRRVLPTLVLVANDQLETVLAWLPDQHDACLSDSPDSLIQHRRDRLAAAQQMHDPLTGLLSRQFVQRAIDFVGTQPDTNLSLTLIDVDHFKRLNDSYGHNVGDEVIRTCARLILDACDQCDLAARFGGEEFAIVSLRDQIGARTLAETLRRSVQDFFAGDLEVTISLGISTTQNDIADVIRHADEALFAAKANGRNCCAHFGDLQQASIESGQHADLIGLENRARVLSERVANFITLRSRSLVNRVQREADTDGLTQFYTRRYLDRRLASQVADAAGPLSIALVDLDHFGQVNKTHGWPSGDKILREVCDVIRGAIRQSDWVGRYGGEEFCVVMPNTSLQDARDILERLRQQVQHDTFLSTSDVPVPMTLSIGVIESSSTENHVELLEQVSQQALRAKRSGRNQVCLSETA